MKTTLKSLALALLSGFTLIGTASAGTKEEGNHHGNTDQILKDYVAVSDALYKDDLKAAKKAAEKLAEGDGAAALTTPAKTLVEAKDIASAREAFKDLSAEAVKRAKAHALKTYTVMACPMVKEGKGVWLSPDAQVNNPYFGAKMAHCGGPKK